jgi:F-type H+-transporting ATPase subunit delta
MRDESIARNYSEALLELARRANAATEWGALINAVASAVENDLMLRRFLAAPQISGDQKIAVIGKALGDKVPAMFVRFLQKLVTNRRQTLIPEIASEYGNLLDAAVSASLAARATVTRACTRPSAAIAAALSKALKKDVVPHVAVDERILGGVIVKFGDTVMDGSVRKRLETLRNRMVGGR